MNKGERKREKGRLCKVLRARGIAIIFKNLRAPLYQIVEFRNAALFFVLVCKVLRKTRLRSVSVYIYRGSKFPTLNL